MDKIKKHKIGYLDGIAFGCGAIPGVLASTIIGSFLTVYLTDIAGISAAVIGTIILVLRITDGFSDLFMGYVIDHTSSRFGKARPWMVVGAVGIAITLYMLFNVPLHLSLTGKIIYFAVMYFMVMTVFVTISGISITTMLPLVTDDIKKRNMLGAAEMGGTIIGGILATTVTAVMLSSFGYSPLGYQKMTLIYGIIILFTGVASFLRLREKDSENPKVGAVKKKEVTIKEAARALKKNKYFFYATIAGLMVNLTNTIISGMGIYFCRDFLGNVDLFSAFTLAFLLPIVLGIAPACALANRFGKHAVLTGGMLIGLVGTTVAAIAVFLPTPNLYLFFGGYILAGFGNSGFSACFQSLLADICDFGTWKTGVKMEGIIFSATSVGNKAGSGFGSAILGWLLTFAAYNGALQVQSAYTISMERMIQAVTPIICYVIVFLCLKLCNLDKLTPVIRKELDAQNHPITEE